MNTENRLISMFDAVGAASAAICAAFIAAEAAPTV